MAAVFLLTGSIQAKEAVDPKTYTVSGTYTYYSSEESLDMIGDVVCFEPDKASFAAMPQQAVRKSKRNGTALWFCFHSGIDAKKAFGITKIKPECTYEGRATISFNKFWLYTEEGDDHSAASLLTVKSKTPAKISCD